MERNHKIFLNHVKKPSMIALQIIFLLLFANQALSKNTSQHSQRKPASNPLKTEFPRVIKLSETISPCENFYGYVCQETIDQFKLRPDRRRHAFAFTDAQDRILDFQKNYLDQLANKNQSVPSKGQKSSPEEIKIESMLKNYYAACMDTKSRASEEIEELKKIIQTQKQTKSKMEWVAKQWEKLKSGEPGYLGLGFRINFDQPKKTDVLIVPTWKFLPEKSYAEIKEVREDLLAFITNFLVEMKKLDPSLPMQDMKKVAELILEHELLVQKMSYSAVEAREAQTKRNFLTREALVKKFPFINLKDLEFLPRETLIQEYNPQSLDLAREVINRYSLEELNWLELFYEGRAYLDFSAPDFFKLRLAFNFKHLGGAEARPALNEECAQSLKAELPSEFDYIILQKMFPNFKREPVEALVGKIRESILTSLRNNQWLTPASKNGAILKIQNAFLRLIAPRTYAEWKLRDHLEFNPRLFHQNNRLISLEDFKKDLSYLTSERDLNSWEGVSTLTANAFYIPNANNFTMLQGILQPPFYSEEQSLVENLAGVGSVIGHELGHSIDDKGSKYNDKGELFEWMKKEDREKFILLTMPLIEQYEKVGLQGKLTLGENIGDLVGVLASFHAAFGDTTKFQSTDWDQHRPDLKKYFINYAKVWCEKQLEGTRLLRIKTGPHSLNEFRVNEIVKHIGAFKEAFQCRENDAMIFPPEKRLKIW